MASPSPIATTPVVARRFLRRTLGFDIPHADVAAALAYHGYIQLDPINICGRMHDLILRNRVADYREGDLMRFLHGANSAPSADAESGSLANGGPAANEPGNRPPLSILSAEKRVAFEHHVPGTGILAAFPLAAWPHLLHAMHRWSLGRGAWAGRLTPREKILAEQLLAEIRARGPLGSEDFDDERRARRVWGASKLVKATLQKLFFHGRILIAQRPGHRRRYDLPERVLPAAVLAQAEPPAIETARWLVLLKLRQRRLVTLTRKDLQLVEDAVQRIVIEDCPPLFCLREDAPLFEAVGVGPASATRRAVAPEPTLPPQLLAPLDPLIYDRRVTAALWNFDYTWEAYTPPAKRVRGYYALPVLAGTEIVGHVDPKADRARRKLVVVSRRVRRGHPIAPALRDFARWLGLGAR